MLRSSWGYAVKLNHTGRASGSTVLYTADVFVHSLWSLTPLLPDEVSDRLLAELKDFAQSDPDRVFPLSRSIQAVNTDFEEDWATSSVERVVNHLLVIYLINPRSGLPPDTGTVIGAVSALPEVNSTVMDQVMSSTGGRIIQPNLSRDKVGELDIYEARVADDVTERSITYMNRGSAAWQLLSDWMSDVSFTAATVWFEGNSLLTAFADGQIWLQGVQPDRVQDAILKTVGKLWPRE